MVQPAGYTGLRIEPVIAKSTKPRAPRRSVTDSMPTTAEKLWSAKTRGILEFEPMPPTAVMPVGGVRVVAGPDGGNGRFEVYLKQAKVVARLEAEGFETVGPYRWFLERKPGVATPEQKMLDRALTPEQRAEIKLSRLAALQRKHAAAEARQERKWFPNLLGKMDDGSESEDGGD